MTTNYFQLSHSVKNRFASILKLFLGVACITIGIYWAVYEISVAESIGSAWFTVLFLFGFGFYEIWAGLGKAERYIEIDNTFIRLKRTIFLSAKHIEAPEIGKIEIFPLKIYFHLKTGAKITLRFGTTYIEVNEKIVDALIKFAEQNSVDLDLQPEELLN